MTEADERILLARICLIFAYIGLLLSFIQGVVVRRLLTRISEGPLALVGLGLSIAGFLLLGIVVSARGLGLVPLMLATAVEVAGIAMATPAVQSLVSRRGASTAQGGNPWGRGKYQFVGANDGHGLWFRVVLHADRRITLLVFCRGDGLAAALIAIAIPQGQDWVEKTETAGVSLIAALYQAADYTQARNASEAPPARRPLLVLCAWYHQPSLSLALCAWYAIPNLMPNCLEIVWC